MISGFSPRIQCEVLGGALFGHEARVSMAWSLMDPISDVVQMLFFHGNAVWSGWEAYTASKVWPSNSGNGSHFVSERGAGFGRRLTAIS